MNFDSGNIHLRTLHSYYPLIGHYLSLYWIETNKLKSYQNIFAPNSVCLMRKQDKHKKAIQAGVTAIKSFKAFSELLDIETRKFLNIIVVSETFSRNYDRKIVAFSAYLSSLMSTLWLSNAFFVIDAKAKQSDRHENEIVLWQWRVLWTTKVELLSAVLPALDRVVTQIRWIE